MRYGLLNDARVLDKDAWPLMVERYVALAYDKGVMQRQRPAAAAAVAAQQF
jgi:heptosyltransferase-2